MASSEFFRSLLGGRLRRGAEAAAQADRGPRAGGGASAR